MPYLTRKDRERLHKTPTPKTSGDLNYVFTTFIDAYIAEKGTSYQTYNDIIGALEGAKLELYRRKTAPYEDSKMIQNGEVYTQSKGK